MRLLSLALALFLALPAYAALKAPLPTGLHTLLVADPVTAVFHPVALSGLGPNAAAAPGLARIHSPLGFAAMVEGAPAARAALHADLAAQPALIEGAREAAFASLARVLAQDSDEARQTAAALSERYAGFFDGVAANAALAEPVRLAAREIVSQLHDPRRDAQAPARQEPPAPGARYAVESSRPSLFGRVMRLVWPAHTLIRVKDSRVAIDPHLPAALKEFPQANPSTLTKLKKNVLFSRPVVGLIRLQLAKTFTQEEGGRSEREIFDALPVDAKYNIVIEPGAISVMKLDHGPGLLRYSAKALDWVLSKHVLMSGYSRDVRFAGEVWKGADGAIHLSNNSGTYRPSVEQLNAAVAYVAAVFPNTRVFADPAGLDVPAAPAAPKKKLVERMIDKLGGSDSFKMEARRKLIHQKNWMYLLGFLAMGYPTTPLVFAVFTTIVGIIGALRLHHPVVRAWWQRKFGAVMRPRESTQMSGFFYGALGMTITTALFGWSTPLVAAGALAYVLGDAISPLVGKRFGWIPFKVAGAQRSVDGALASFTAMLVCFLLLGFPALVALGGALTFSAVDVYPVKPDDNLWNPVVVSTALFVFSLLAGFPL